MENERKMKDYQFVVISLNKERKERIESQFQSLNIQDVYYMDAATIENSKDYLPETGYTEIEKKTICCARSHLFCLEYACLQSSPEYTIILEDDVALHKTQLINAIEEIVRRWDHEFVQCGLISLGWIPIESYEVYSNFNPIARLQYAEGSKILRLINSGLQMYIVKKSRIKGIIPFFICPTFLRLKQIIDHYKQQSKNTTLNCMIADLFINVIIPQGIVHPPLAIEQQITSSLHHRNWILYWSKYFKHREARLKDYFFF